MLNKLKIFSGVGQYTIPIIMGLIVVLVFQYAYFNNRLENLSRKLDYESKLNNSLIDTVKTYKNVYNEVTSEKLTIQYDLDLLKEKYSKLTVNQQELLDRISALTVKNHLISAALIETEFKLDSILNDKPLILGDKIIFRDSLEDINYLIEIHNAKLVESDKLPSLLINNIGFTNKQFVQFHWKDNKKEGYPVSFSVSNSNKYLKTVDIDSYIIPEIAKDQLKPSFFKKIGDIINNNGLIVIGTTGIIFGTIYLL